MVRAIGKQKRDDEGLERHFSICQKLRFSDKLTYYFVKQNFCVEENKFDWVKGQNVDWRITPKRIMFRTVIRSKRKRVKRQSRMKKVKM